MNKLEPYYETFRMSIKLFVKDFRIVLAFFFMILYPIVLFNDLPVSMLEYIRNSEIFHAVIVWPNILQFIKMVRFFTIFLTCDIISMEYSNSTMISLASTPIPRHVIIIGRYITYVLIFFLIETIGYFIWASITNSSYEFQIYPSVMWSGYCIILLANLLTLSISVFLSALLKKPLSNLIFHFIFILVGEPLLESFRKWRKFSVSYNIEVIITNLEEMTKEGVWMTSLNIVTPLIPFLGLSIIFLILSSLIFNLRDLKND